jgi:hypothetical protein
MAGHDLGPGVDGRLGEAPRELSRRGAGVPGLVRVEGQDDDVALGAPGPDGLEDLTHVTLVGDELDPGPVAPPDLPARDDHVRGRDLSAERPLERVELLAWGLSHRTEKELREAALQNPSTPDEAIEAVAPGLPENLAELVVINQVRLLRRTTLLVALEGNPDLSADQRRRLRELRESFHIGEKPVEAPPPPPPPPEAPPEEEAAVEPVEGEGEVLTEEQAIARYLTADERQHEERVSAVQMVYRMNAAQKVIAALKESREVRAILVRDPNRIVSSAVLGSPKLTEPEIESFSGMRGVSTEVLRAIASNKDWTKRYGVIANLVKNPRSPLPIALNLIPRLNPRDLKTISVDRNVPEAIRKHAAKFIRGAPAAGGGGGKR